MGDKDKRSAFTTVVMSDIENNTQEVMYNSYTLPLLIYNGTDMSKLIEKIEAVPDKGITIQNDIVFYDSTYESANDTFEFVLITLNELEGTQTHSLAELIEDGFTITPFINGGGGDSDFSTANVTLINSGGEGTFFTFSGMPALIEHGDETYLESTTTSQIAVSKTIKTVLYLGTAIIYPNYFDKYDTETLPTTEGDVTLDMDAGGFLVTGDCTISLKGTGSMD